MHLLGKDEFFLDHFHPTLAHIIVTSVQMCRHFSYSDSMISLNKHHTL